MNMSITTRWLSTNGRKLSSRFNGSAISAAAVVVSLLALPATASSATLTPTATGDQLAGGFVTVTYFGGPMETEIILAGPGNTGMTDPVSAGFAFSVSGDTFLNEWTLENFGGIGSSPRAIVGVVFDLTGSISLFDNDSAPSSPGSDVGRAGATFVAGPPIGASAEFSPWLDPVNTGDMFLAESIGWGGGGIAAGAMARWMDDTDATVIPLPSALILFGSGLSVALIRIRKRSGTLRKA